MPFCLVVTEWEILTNGHRSLCLDHPTLLGAPTAKAFEDVDSQPAKKARKFIKKPAAGRR